MGRIYDRRPSRTDSSSGPPPYRLRPRPARSIIAFPAAYQSTQETTTALVDDCRTTPLLEGHSELFLRSLGLKVFQCRRTHAMNESPVSPACPAGPNCNQPTTWDILIVPPHRVSQDTLRNLHDGHTCQNTTTVVSGLNRR